MTNRRMPWETTSSQDARAQALLARMTGEADSFDRRAGEAKRKAEDLKAWVNADTRRYLNGEQQYNLAYNRAQEKAYTEAATTIRLLLSQTRSALGVR